MSRSRRKTPVFGITTATSEKQDKRMANRRYRRKVKHAVRKEAEAIPCLREVSNVWSFSKDGKRYVRPSGWGKEFLKKAMRK